MAGRKTVLFAFRGDPMCFIHVLLNGLDLHDQGLGGEIVLEGEAPKLVPAIAKQGHPLNTLYRKAKSVGLFIADCRACSTKMGVAESIEKEGLPLAGDMNGHPSMSQFVQRGYAVVTL